MAIVINISRHSRSPQPPPGEPINIPPGTPIPLPGIGLFKQIIIENYENFPIEFVIGNNSLFAITANSIGVTPTVIPSNSNGGFILKQNEATELIIIPQDLNTVLSNPMLIWIEQSNMQNVDFIVWLS